MTGDEQLELERILVELETARDVARQLRAALADLVPPHASWCMGHEGGVVDGPHGRIGVGKLVVVDCRCEPTVRAAREALASSARALR